jgi:hypothetical protein
MAEKQHPHGTLEQLRDRFPGKWLLIQLDDLGADEGTVLAAHENPESMDEEMERLASNGVEPEKPLYLTHSIAEGQDLPAFAL